jgi:hypothetical protein
MHKHPHKTETSAQPVPAQSAGEIRGTAGTNEQVQRGNAKPQAVRVRAYQKWEAAGKPKGDGVNFWIEAEQELLQVK